MHRRVREITGADPLPYGMEPNRRVLEELARAAVDQHILDRARRTWTSCSRPAPAT